MLAIALAGCSPSTSGSAVPSTTLGAPPTTLSSEFDQLVPVTLAYNVQDHMRVGRTYRQKVLVARDSEADLLERFRDLGPVKQQQLLANARLRVRLIGDPDTFTIIPLNTEDQLLAVLDEASWEWNVTPRRGGRHELHVVLSLRIATPQGLEAQDRPPITLPVSVDEPRWNRVQRFVGAYWQWLTTVLLLPVLAWLGRRLAQRRQAPQPGDDADAPGAPVSHTTPVVQTIYLPDGSVANGVDGQEKTHRAAGAGRWWRSRLTARRR
jgi:hypothetical protein